jgi:putative Mg2+ transporter-C (MgtC) family protein
MEWFRFDWALLGVVLFKLILAFLFTLPVAWERERSTRIMGLRTFPLVAIASCSYILIAISIDPDGLEARGRAIQGLLGGIGFIGGGAILKEGANVKGTATAASIWATGAIGVAIAFSRYEIAIILSLLTFILLQFLTPIEERIGKEDDPNEEKRSGEDNGADNDEGNDEDQEEDESGNEQE